MPRGPGALRRHLLPPSSFFGFCWQQRGEGKTMARKEEEEAGGGAALLHGNSLSWRRRRTSQWIVSPYFFLVFPSQFNEWLSFWLKKGSKINPFFLISHCNLFLLFVQVHSFIHFVHCPPTHLTIEQPLSAAAADADPLISSADFCCWRLLLFY